MCVNHHGLLSLVHSGAVTRLRPLSHTCPGPRGRDEDPLCTKDRGDTLRTDYHYIPPDPESLGPRSVGVTSDSGTTTLSQRLNSHGTQ